MKRLLIPLMVLLVSVSTAQAPRLPEGFIEELYEGGLSAPTAMAFAPNGSLFVTEQGGDVRIIDNTGTLLGTEFTSFAVDDDGERGLLGIAFDPDYNTNHYVYFYWTKPISGEGPRNRVDRVTANAGSTEAVAGAPFEVFELPELSATNHNGGAIHFGADGKLYAGVGENAVASNSQTLTNRLGKILRYNADGSIPSDNPFFGTATGQNRSIWALGLRNPFTFAFQPGTGKLHINDVGGGSWEEINLGAAGANYGWPNEEGVGGNPSYVDPIHAYENPPDDCAAIAGGAFYNPANVMFPASYLGSYFFTDLCAGEIRRLDAGNNASVFAESTMGGSIVDVQIGPDGALYYLSRGSGAVFRIAYVPEPAVGELVSNGSFENDDNGDGIPNKWSLVNVNAKRVCGGAFVTDGSCALKVKRKGSTSGKVQQKIAGGSIVDGTSLALSAMVTGTNVPAGALIRMRVITIQGTDDYNLPIPTGTYAAMPISHPPVVTEGQGKKIKLYIIYPNAGGKVWADEVSIMATPPARR